MKKSLPGILVCILALVFFAVWQVANRTKGTNEDGEKKNRDPILVQEWLDANKAAGQYDKDCLSMDTNYTVGAKRHAAAITIKLLERGANLTPAVVEALRIENDPTNLTNLVFALDRATSITLPYRYPSFSEAMSMLPSVRDEFLKDWDAGNVLRPEEKQDEFARLVFRAAPEGRIIPEEFKSILAHGIYALPLTISFLGKTNSPYAMAVFINLALLLEDFEYWIYHRKMYTTHQEKLAKARNWWESKHTKFNELHPLYEKIDAAVKALPKFEEETNSLSAAAGS